MNKILTAENFIREKYKELILIDKSFSEEIDEDSLKQTINWIIEFAKLHVTAALESCHITCKNKFIAGETGYLKQEDVELSYSLNNIK